MLECGISSDDFQSMVFNTLAHGPHVYLCIRNVLIKAPFHTMSYSWHARSS